MSKKEFLITIALVVVLFFVMVSRLYDAGRSRDDFSDLRTPGVTKMADVQTMQGANAELHRK